MEGEGVLLEPTKGITEGEELLALHRLRGNGNFPNRRNKVVFTFAVDSNLSFIYLLLLLCIVLYCIYTLYMYGYIKDKGLPYI